MFSTITAVSPRRKVHRHLLLVEGLQQDLGTLVVAEAADLRLDRVQRCLHLGAHRLVAAVQEAYKEMDKKYKNLQFFFNFRIMKKATFSPLR